ncbi:Hypothetical protein HVPorG_03562 [Roseomonas mucosa]|uniref:hypothetical protein n=1 Tax=Roseomonas mucosa TaxID=207340 RepID=UPI0021FC0D61|nr:hypothetical protein [Roseomonas mucosa]QDJ10630.1 Hypothetical protein HVPorG_03562 [Roseomonas mucosa]
MPAEPLFRHLGRLLRREPWWAEFWAGAGCLVWTLWTFLAAVEPGARPTFRLAISLPLPLADERFWQASGAVLGLIQVASLLADHRRARRAASFLGSWWWTTLFLALLLADPAAPAMALYAVMAAINLVSLVRLRPELP